MEAFTTINNYIDSCIKNFDSIELKRKEDFTPFITYLQDKKSKNEIIQLLFVCTHNSRRSHLSQIWAHIAADYFNTPIKAYSAGTEATAMNHRIANTLSAIGLKVIKTDESENPVYNIYYKQNTPPITTFSKAYDHPSIPKENIAAIMTCDHADENCPYIPGTTARIPLRYDDPKTFDDTTIEAEKYAERCKQIATELLYIFSKIK